MIGSHEGTAHFLFSLMEIFFLFPLIFPAHSLSKQQENCLIIPWPWFFFCPARGEISINFAFRLTISPIFKNFCIPSVNFDHYLFPSLKN